MTDLSKIPIEATNPLDCEVCEKLIAKKHGKLLPWKIICIILAALLAILIAAFAAKSGSLVIGSQDNSTQLEQSGNDNSVVGDGGIIIGSDNASVNQRIEQQDNTIVTIVAIVAGTAVVISTAVMLFNYRKRSK